MVRCPEGQVAAASWPVLQGFALMSSMITTQAPLVTCEALRALTRQLVECYAPEKVILFGSLARGAGRWDSDADILVVMPFEGRHLAKIREMRRLCPVRFPLDLLVRRTEEVEVRLSGRRSGCSGSARPWRGVAWLNPGRSRVDGQGRW